VAAARPRVAALSHSRQGEPAALRWRNVPARLSITTRRRRAVASSQSAARSVIRRPRDSWLAFARGESRSDQGRPVPGYTPLFWPTALVRHQAQPISRPPVESATETTDRVPLNRQLVLLLMLTDQWSRERLSFLNSTPAPPRRVRPMLGWRASPSVPRLAACPASRALHPDVQAQFSTVFSPSSMQVVLGWSSPRSASAALGGGPLAMMVRSATQRQVHELGRSPTLSGERSLGSNGTLRYDQLRCCCGSAAPIRHRLAALAPADEDPGARPGIRPLATGPGRCAEQTTRISPAPPEFPAVVSGVARLQLAAAPVGLTQRNSAAFQAVAGDSAGWCWGCGFVSWC